METLLIEIGAEEIPAGYIVPALKAFKKNLLSKMAKEKIESGKCEYFGTPRRLALIIENVATEQKSESATIFGPPESVGFDENGQPTKAAIGFAKKAGISVEQITITEQKKGKYLTAKIESKALSSVEILERILSEQILLIPFPKVMKWGDLSIMFARPIISLTGLLGKEVLNFKIGNIESSSYIFGHQFMYPEKYIIESADQYLSILETKGVMPDIEKRKSLLKKTITKAAQDYDSLVVEDEELLDIVTNVVEYPYPVVGKFDDQFLEVPDEVLITAMREHQKYFALRDEKGNLKPYFIAVNNTRVKDMDIVANGHERVLRARLSDAKFFWEQDLKSSVDDFAEKLKKVTFQADLGSVFDKRERVIKIAENLSEKIDSEDNKALKINVKRAAEICKADLVSQVVIEFTKLQGVMGKIYAAKSGENEEVADAVEQHYRPVFSGGKLPENDTARLLSISDKIDTICGCFSIGLIPSGGADPYALRRQGIGILQIMLDRELDFSLTEIVGDAVRQFVKDGSKASEIIEKVIEFFKVRMVNILTEKGASKEAVKSALAASFDNIPDAALRINAIDALRKQPDFEPLSIAFKRVGNILKKSAPEEALNVDAELLEDNAEKELYNAVKNFEKEIKSLTEKGDYDGALKKIALLRPYVDDFFDNVMVMVDDTKVKANRIALLLEITKLFGNIADFSIL
ncbi:MAG: glycine--tRNA ligase subunit beta [Desulfobacteraceae bacterium]|nr:glycine--tRNA ligase subunit beta [Desulfobacteraceae bacterium]